jgi:hypothetical protein
MVVERHPVAIARPPPTINTGPPILLEGEASIAQRPATGC